MDIGSPKILLPVLVPVGGSFIAMTVLLLNLLLSVGQCSTQLYQTSTRRGCYLVAMPLTAARDS